MTKVMENSEKKSLLQRQIQKITKYRKIFRKIHKLSCYEITKHKLKNHRFDLPS